MPAAVTVPDQILPHLFHLSTIEFFGIMWYNVDIVRKEGYNMPLPLKGLALLTDLDGTLLTPEKTLLPADAAAIAAFREQGGLFSIATGRGMQATEAYLNLFQPDFPAVMYNGALLYDYRKHQTAAAFRLPAETENILRELMHAFPEVGAEVLREDGVFVIQDSPIERRHLEITNVPVVLKSLDEIPPVSCLKALFAGEEQDIARMQEYVRAPRFSAVNFTRSHRWFLEILPKDAGKGAALRQIRQMLPEHTVIGATGDFDNDITMLREADFCGCPADSHASVLQTVSETDGFLSAKTCKNGFFSEWIEEFTRHYLKL